MTTFNESPLAAANGLFVFLKNMKVYSFLAFILVLGSCQKAKFPSEYSKGLLGVWEWEYSNLKSKNLDDTPENTGETRQLEFKENGKYLEFVNGKRVLKGDYHIVSENQGQSINVFMEHNDTENIFLFLNPNGEGKLHINSFTEPGTDYDLKVYSRRE